MWVLRRNSRIFLPKLGWLRYRASREVLGEMRQVTVSRRAGKWLVSIQTEHEIARPVPKANRMIGIDMGVARFATMSTGEFLAPLGSFKRHERALRKAQQALSRKARFSHNWRPGRRDQHSFPGTESPAGRRDGHGGRFRWVRECLRAQAHSPDRL